MEPEASAFEPFAANGTEEATELARLADELVDQIGAARRHYEDLRAAIDGAEVPALEAATRPVDGGDEHELPDAREDAELVAVNMALTGGSRHEAHLHIVETFGIVDTEEILDAAFGSSDEASRQRRFARRQRVAR
jgi:hypothetical protein